MLFCKVHFSKSRAKVQYFFYIRKRAGVYRQKTSIFTPPGTIIPAAGNAAGIRDKGHEKRLEDLRVARWSKSRIHFAIRRRSRCHQTTNGQHRCFHFRLYMYNKYFYNIHY